MAVASVSHTPSVALPASTGVAGAATHAPAISAHLRGRRVTAPASLTVHSASHTPRSAVSASTGVAGWATRAGTITAAQCRRVVDAFSPTSGRTKNDVVDGDLPAARVRGGKKATDVDRRRGW